MTNKLIKNHYFQAFVILSFSTVSQAGAFDYFEAYDIYTLHQKGLTGAGYNISIIETSVSPSHPALLGIKVEPEDKILETGDLVHHGNHVSAIAAGKPTEDFLGGIAPDAQAYLIAKKLNERDTLEQHLSRMLGFIELAARKSHVINLSASLLNYNLSGPQTSLTKDFLAKLKKILVDYDAILVITASNTPVPINDQTSLRYLADLAEDEDLMKNIVIVGNLGFKSEHMLQGEKRFYQERDIILTALDNYPNTKYQQLRPISTLSTDLKQALKQQDPALLVSYKRDSTQRVPEIYTFFKLNSPKDLGTEEELIKLVNQIVTEKIEQRKDRNFDYKDLEEVLDPAYLDTLQKYHKTAAQLLRDYKYVNNDLVRNHLITFINQKVPTSTYSHGERIVSDLEYWLNGSEQDFGQHLSLLKKKSLLEKNTIPAISYNFKDSGYIVSARADKARKHFILTYGKDINSAWGPTGYFIGTGSSQAAPITSGLLVLFHQYKTQILKEPVPSYQGLLEEFKQATRQLGDPEYFGLGMLDVRKLFPTLLPVKNPNWEYVRYEDIIEHAKSSADSYNMDFLETAEAKKRISLTLAMLRAGEIPLGIKMVYYGNSFNDFRAYGYAKSAIAHFVSSTGGFSYRLR